MKRPIYGGTLKASEKGWAHPVERMSSDQIQSCHGSPSAFATEDFLEDVKYLIRRKYGNQTAFARQIPVSRNVISRVINNPERLETYWINMFAERLNMDLRAYIIH